MGEFYQLQRAVAHDACRNRYRTPCTAVAMGTPVRVFLEVLPAVRGLVAGADVLVGSRTAGLGAIAWRRVAMQPCDGGFLATLDLQARPHAAFYAFELRSAGGATMRYVPCADGRSTFGQLVRDGVEGTWDEGGWRYDARLLPAVPPGSFRVPGPACGFQASVYDPAFRTPGWMHGAIMYQAFPDRFARGAGGVLQQGVAYHLAMGRPVHLHASWDEPVRWAQGEAYDPVDFYGGTLDGVRGKLGYLASLGVEALYLNPVFEARSNHRYDTADYLRIDPMLGDAHDFARLAVQARELGISIVLDGVFSHTGDDSRYFDANGAYGGAGAAQGTESPYYSWYDFTPQENGVGYRCWWGHPSLPEVDEHDPAWQRFVLGSAGAESPAQPGAGAVQGGEGPHVEGASEGVLAHWIAQGARGWRLDVADEIPDDVLERIRDSVKRADADAAVIGEVWEDATSKVSYGVPRTYALGRSLDSVMNYPLRQALLGFALGSVDAMQLAAFLNGQAANYPPQMHACLMNLLGSHDLERVRSALSLGGSLAGLPREDQLRLIGSITPEQDERAACLQRMLVGLLYALPGMPCVYYGDEAGLQGGTDPFCRASMPWDGERARRNDCGCDLTAFYQMTGQLRKESDVLRRGGSHCLAAGGDVLFAVRWTEGGDAGDAGACRVVAAVANRAEVRRQVAFDLRRAEGLPVGCVSDGASLPVLMCSGGDASARAQLEGGIVTADVPACSTAWFFLS